MADLYWSRRKNMSVILNKDIVAYFLYEGSENSEIVCPECLRDGEEPIEDNVITAAGAENLRQNETWFCDRCRKRIF